MTEIKIPEAHNFNFLNHAVCTVDRNSEGQHLTVPSINNSSITLHIHCKFVSVEKMIISESLSLQITKLSDLFVFVSKIST